MLDKSSILDDPKIYDSAKSEYGGTSQSLMPPLLLQYWQTVIRWKWVIIGIISSSLIAGLVITLMLTPKFTAKSTLEISRDQKSITKIGGLDSENAGRDLEFYQTQYSLLKSRSLAERVARELKLGSDDGFFAAHGVSSGDKLLFSASTGSSLTALARVKREKLAVALLLENINISPIRTSSLVDVNYTSSSPEFSTRIANTWTQICDLSWLQ